jgi:hypothetical protein
VIDEVSFEPFTKRPIGKKRDGRRIYTAGERVYRQFIPDIG